jgi:hypothetical protein
MTFSGSKGLFDSAIDNDFPYIHVSGTRKQTGTENDFLTARQLTEMGKSRRIAIGARVV